MGIVVRIRRKSLLKRCYHKLFECPTFWSFKPHFTCPGCGATYRCYWDGNDITGHGINYCETCRKELED